MSATVTQADLIPLKPVISRHGPQQEISTPSLPDTLHDDTTYIDSAPLAQSPEVASTLPLTRVVIIIAALSGINFVSSFSNGVLTVALPRIAHDLELPGNLLLWPQSVSSLTSGSVLLLSGSIGDLVGSRRVYLIGCFSLAWMIIGCGLARNGIELIIFRALQGIAVSLCFPNSVSILARHIKNGKTRNIGLSCLGMGMCLGFLVGLVFAGILVETVGWRLGYYACGGLSFIFYVASVYSLPADKILSRKIILRKLLHDIDWVGAGIACGCLASFSYVLAMITSSVEHIKEPKNIVLLSTSFVLAPAFILWVGRQEKKGYPALVPNSIWKNGAFTTTCLMVLASNAVMQSMELFCSLFFQEVQDLSALQASLRFLPASLIGAALNLTTGIFVDKVPAVRLITSSMLLSAGAPLLMALINPSWPYWYDAFFAQVLSPLSAEVLFTVGFIIMSETFSDETQALAGGVFNTVGQLGNSIGLAVMGIISTAATQNSDYAKKMSPAALMVGYRATFWACFAWTVLACLIGAIGLRKVGKVGLKRD